MRNAVRAVVGLVGLFNIVSWDSAFCSTRRRPACGSS